MLPGPGQGYKAAGRALEGLALDATGKLHGKIERGLAGKLKDVPRERLGEFADDLQESIKVRKAEQLRLGEDGPHRARIGQEESLLRQVLKILGGS